MVGQGTDTAQQCAAMELIYTLRVYGVDLPAYVAQLQ